MPLTAIAAALGQEVVLSAATPVLRELVGLQDEQLRQLRAIREDVQALATGPWRTARVRLSEAADTPGDDPERAVHLRGAQEALYTAYGMAPDASARRAPIAADLAMVYGLLGRRRECDRWAATAHADSETAVVAAIPEVTAAVNRRVWSFYDDVFRNERLDFWSPVTGSYHSASKQQIWPVFRKVYERGLEVAGRDDDEMAEILGVDRSTEVGKVIVIIFAAHRLTKPADDLMRLHHLSREVSSYRATRIALDPSLDLPERRLAVALAAVRQATITWG